MFEAIIFIFVWCLLDVIYKAYKTPNPPKKPDLWQDHKKMKEHLDWMKNQRM